MVVVPGGGVGAAAPPPPPMWRAPKVSMRALTSCRSRRDRLPLRLLFWAVCWWTRREAKTGVKMSVGSYKTSRPREVSLLPGWVLYASCGMAPL